MDKAYPAGLARERAWLQATVAVLSLVPITAGAAGLLGPGFAGGPAGVPDLASHFAYLSGLLLGLGLGFLALVPGIERQGLLFRSAAGVVVLGGLARLSAVALAGPPSLPHRPALVMELGVVPAIAAWQARIARRCAALSVA
jgi:Domain of unknown function (DUF4345)